MNIAIILGGKVFSGAEITTLRFARALPDNWSRVACADPRVAGHAAAFGIGIREWDTTSAADDPLLRASHFISEPEQDNQACLASRDQLARIMDELKPDMVLACMFPVAMLALPVLLKTGIPLVVHHQLMYKDLPDHPIIKPVRRVADHARMIVAASNAVARPLLKSGIENVRVVHAGLPDSYAAGRSGRHAPQTAAVPQMLSVGTWGPVKGLEVLIEAADILHRRGLKFHLNVLGPLDRYSADYGRKIEQMARHGTDLGYVSLLGPRTNPQQFYDRSDMMVVPSTEPDPFPTVTLEAMAYGLPVVASATGGLLEQIVEDETGCLVPAGDAGALAEKCSMLLQNPEIRRSMGAKGRERFERLFRLGGQAKKFVAALEASA